MATGYGVETWCTDQIRTGRFARGAVVVGQALFRRAITPRGTLLPLEDEPEADEDEGAYGLDLAGFVGSVGYPFALRAIPSMLGEEFRKDDRVADVLVTVASVQDPNGAIALEVAADVALKAESETFTLTLSVTEFAATLVGIS